MGLEDPPVCRSGYTQPPRGCQPYLGRPWKVWTPSDTDSWIGVFDIPPPSPPPELTMWEKTGNWIVGHRWKAFGIGLCFVLGSGLLAGYANSRWRARRVRSKTKTSGKKKERKEVAVVLGADSPLGFQLVLELESRGFIVVASVSKNDAIEEVESAAQGYVRALLLDPSDPASVPVFIRSLQTSLSLRFPITTSGDPYYPSPSHHPHICAVISLLSLQDPPPPTPFEHLSLSSTYLTYMQQSHLTPLQTLQNLLPLMRVPGNDINASSSKRKKKVVICLPVIASRVGVSWNAAQAMTAGATTKAIDVLRRELRDSSQASNISVTVAEIGFVGLSSNSNYSSGAAAYMSDWSPNIRSTYGPAYLGALEHARLNPRTPDNIRDAVNKLVSLADEPHGGVLRRLCWQYRIPRERELIGAGAYTYMLASKLPEWILDGLLSLPARLGELRDAIVPIILHPEEPQPVEPEEEEDMEEAEVDADELNPDETESQPEKTKATSSGYSSGAESLGLNSDKIGSSWVSLNEQQE